MSTAQTILRLIQASAERAPDSDAFLAPDLNPLSYSGLSRLAETTVAALNRFGIGRNDSVCVVLPNGPTMASVFVCCSAGCTCAPLNPGYRREELEFYLDDLSAKALIVEEGAQSPATEAAQALGIPLIEARVDSAQPAGWFALQGEPRDLQSAGGFAEPSDVGLVLHTSGTTARPKIVPLTQANLAASASHISATLRLTSQDRCLNIMPLFHIHGLIGALLSSINAGAEVVCTPGFNPMKFFGWLDQFKPSWYSAVPTMHQTILARARRNAQIITDSRLRLIRSSSAALPPQVLAELEKTFDAPVVESYGMTEATHQMTSNPLPPAARKPGLVGLPAGPQVSIMNDSGDHLPTGETAEIVIKGPNVTPGYANNPEANEKSFTDGWFRTGDQGRIDEDGYLFITGRLKEIINRGGEKISPREIDEVLLDHEAVAQAVTFATPHDKLGEEVAAAIVLAPSATATEREIRDFASQRLADFKVPRKVLFLDEIPKGPTGKVQRIGLAAKLGLG